MTQHTSSRAGSTLDDSAVKSAEATWLCLPIRPRQSNVLTGASNLRHQWPDARQQC